MLGQTDIATFAMVGIVLFAIGAILVYFMGQRK
jgi:Sec-independent protein secretion pathway component TatC